MPSVCESVDRNSTGLWGIFEPIFIVCALSSLYSQKKHPTYPKMDIEAQCQPFLQHNIEGKPALIHDYCAEAQADGRDSCIWICFQEQNKTRAKDVVINPDCDVFDFSQLLKHCGWWRRLSMYSVVGIRLVEVCTTIVVLPSADTIFSRLNCTI